MKSSEFIYVCEFEFSIQVLIFFLLYGFVELEHLNNCSVFSKLSYNMCFTHENNSNVWLVVYSLDFDVFIVELLYIQKF